MLYAIRDEAGNIISIASQAENSDDQPIQANDQDVIEFIFKNTSNELSKRYLSHTDADMVRIVEDLVELLIRKNLIMLTDLPEAAREKLLSRQQIRAKFSPGSGLLVDDDNLL